MLSNRAQEKRFLSCEALRLLEYFPVGSILEEATGMIREGTRFGDSVNEADISLLQSRKVISVPCPSFFIQTVMRMLLALLQSSTCPSYSEYLSPFVLVMG